MKKDIELIRKIIIYIEEEVEFGKVIDSDEIYNALSLENENHFLYQIYLMADSGLINIKDTTTFAGKSYMIKEITYMGQDFLDSIKDDKVWSHVKSKVIKIGGVSLDLLTEIGKEFIKQEVLER